MPRKIPVFVALNSDWGNSGVLQRFPCNFQCESLLRIHAGCFSWGNLKKLCVELIHLIEKSSPACHHLAGLVGIGIVICVRIPPIRREPAKSHRDRLEANPKSCRHPSAPPGNLHPRPTTAIGSRARSSAASSFACISWTARNACFRSAELSVDFLISSMVRTNFHHANRLRNSSATSSSDKSATSSAVRSFSLPTGTGEEDLAARLRISRLIQSSKQIACDRIRCGVIENQGCG